MIEGIQKTILLVEDEILIAMSEKIALEKYRYNVIIVNSGEKAIEIVKKTPKIDLILMDIDLGKGIDGTQAAEIILKDRDIPVVFLSSHDEPEIVEKTEKITSYGYIVKNSSLTVIDTSIKMAFKLFNLNKTIQEKESDYRIFFENSLNAVGLHEIILDDNGDPVDYIFLQVNKAFEKHTGLYADDIINRRVTEVYPGIETTNLINLYGNVALTGKSISFETYFEPSNRFFNISAYQAGKGRFAVVFENITERKLAEKKLHDSEEKYRSLVENINEGIALHEIITDDDNQPIDFVYLAVNPVYEEITHLKAIDIIGKRGLEVIPHLEKKWIDLYGKVAQTGEAILIEDHSEYLDSYWEVKAYSPKINQFAVALTNITQRKQLEETYRQSEERFQRLIKNSSDIIVLIDIDGTQRYVSPSAKRITGFEPEELMGKSLREIIHPDDIDRVLQEWNKSIGHPGSAVTIKYRHIHKTRGWVYLEAVGQNLINEPSIKGIVSNVRDISQRREMENKLIKNERKFRVLFDNSPFGIYMANPDGSIVDVNHRLLEILDSPSIEMTRQINVLKYPPLIEKGYAAAFKKCVDMNTIIQIEFEYQSKWDRTSYLKSYLVPVTNSAGKVEMIYTLIEDLTDQKKSERMMSYLSAVVEHSDEIVVVKDLDLRVIATNQAFANVSGHKSIETMLGKTDAEIFNIPPEAEPIRSYMEDERAAQKLSPGDYILREEPVITPTGEIRQVRTKKYPIFDAANQLVATGNISVDITELKSSEELIKQQLQEKDILLREVHHRIKNNIASIGYLLIMHYDRITNPEARAALQDAISRIQSMATLYENLLLTENLQQLFMKNYLEQLTESIVSIFPNHPNIIIQNQIEDIALDSKRVFTIGLIVNELLTNSFKYAFKERDKGQIQMRLYQSGNQITLSIKDDGIGLPEDFDLERSRGFGIMLVKMLTQQLKGEFKLESIAGTKSTITFDL